MIRKFVGRAVLRLTRWRVEGLAVGGFGLVVHPTSDVAADMDLFRSFYADIQGKFPDNVGEIRLRDEEAGKLPAAG